MKPVRVEPEAKEELAAAVAWYEDRRTGLGRELLAEVDSVFAAIARKPDRFPFFRRVNRELGVRRAATRRLPYSVAFLDLEAVVRVHDGSAVEPQTHVSLTSNLWAIPRLCTGGSVGAEVRAKSRG